LRGAYVFTWIHERIFQPLGDSLFKFTASIPRVQSSRFSQKHKKYFWQIILLITFIWVADEIFRLLVEAIQIMHGALSLGLVLHIIWLGFLTLLRVIAMTVLATLIWTPIGVWIGFQPKIARIAQPLAQIGASFPVNMTFPIVVGVFVAFNIPMNWGSILLIAMGTQWYILFNVIAGAMAIPNDLKEAAQIYGLKNWNLWKTMILPAIFPFWVTGACTAAGGAWNASIVAELATWGDTTLKADGLGSYIADVTKLGDTPMIVLSIAIMSLFVVLMNKFIWRKLYAFAEKRFKLD
jgi:NitT/TauT family transport system permease protein